MARKVIRWTREALERVEKAPDFVRPGIYRLMEKRARERGVDLITSAFLTEIRNESMMLAAQRMKGLGIEDFTMEAFDRAMERMGDRRREVLEEIVAFLKGRGKKREYIISLFREYLSTPPSGMPWEREALDLAASQGGEDLRETIEREAGRKGYKVVTLAFLRGWLRQRKPPWTEGARRRLEAIPIPSIRKGVERLVSEYACSRGYPRIDERVFSDAVKDIDPGRGLP